MWFVISLNNTSVLPLFGEGQYLFSETLNVYSFHNGFISDKPAIVQLVTLNATIVYLDTSMI
jgi:hypothetical protein